jgi:hypothetical protein
LLIQDDGSLGQVGFHAKLESLQLLRILLSIDAVLERGYREVDGPGRR